MHFAFSFHYTSFYYISLNFTPLHFASLHYISLNLTSLQYGPLNFTSLQFTTLYYTSLNFTSPHFTSLHFTPQFSRRCTICAIWKSWLKPAPACPDVEESNGICTDGFRSLRLKYGPNPCCSSPVRLRLETY